jgi:hypothetical protein
MKKKVNVLKSKEDIKEVPQLNISTTPQEVKFKSLNIFSNFKNKFLGEIEKEQIEKTEKARKEFFKPKPFCIYEPKTWYDVKKHLNKLEVDQSESKIMLIQMELINGKYDEFTIQAQHDSFVWENKRYIIDDDFKFYNIPAKMFCLRYHEKVCLPVDTRIEVNSLLEKTQETAEETYNKLLESDDENIKKVIKSIPKPDLIQAFNPNILEKFIISHVIEKVIKGQEMEDIFSFIKIMLIVNSVILVILSLAVGYSLFR